MINPQQWWHNLQQFFVKPVVRLIILVWLVAAYICLTIAGVRTYKQTQFTIQVDYQHIIEIPEVNGNAIAIDVIASSQEEMFILNGPTFTDLLMADYQEHSGSFKVSRPLTTGEWVTHANEPIQFTFSNPHRYPVKVKPIRNLRESTWFLVIIFATLATLLISLVNHLRQKYSIRSVP